MRRRQSAGVATRSPRRTDVERLGLASLRRRPSQQRGVQRVTDVLDAFELLLSRKRCEEITMDDLSRTAAIRIGSLYHFFPDMTSVILTALERALADEGAAFESRAEDAGLDLPGYLDALERRMAAVWRRHGGLLAVFFAYQRHPLIWKLTRQQREATAALIATKLRTLRPGVAVPRALELGRTISMVMAVLVDNLEYLPAEEARALRRETRLMLCRYVDAEQPAPPGKTAAGGLRRLRRTFRATRS